MCSKIFILQNISLKICTASFNLKRNFEQFSIQNEKSIKTSVTLQTFVDEIKQNLFIKKKILLFWKKRERKLLFSFIEKVGTVRCGLRIISVDVIASSAL